MTEVLIVQEDQSIASVERWLSVLGQYRDPIDLLLPTRVRHAQFGGLMSLIQLIITWARRTPEGALRMHAISRDEARTRLPRLATFDHGAVALLMAADVRDRNGRMRLDVEAAAAVAPR